MSKERAVPLEFEGESLESAFVGRRDGAGAADGHPDPDRDGRHRPRERVRPAAGRAWLQCASSPTCSARNFTARRATSCFGEMTRLRGDRARASPPAAACARTGARPRRGRADQIVVAGYCFGGQCALDLARERRGHRRRGQLPRPVRPARPSAGEDQRESRRLPRLGRPDGAARQGGRPRQGADRGRRRLADPRLRPCRPRLHQPARERAADRGRRLQRARRRAQSWTSSSTCSRNCSAEHDDWADRSRGRQPADAAGEGDRAARQALSRPGRAGDFRRGL